MVSAPSASNEAAKEPNNDKPALPHAPHHYKSMYAVPTSIGGFAGVALLATTVIASVTVLLGAPVLLPTANGPDYIAVAVIFFVILMVMEIVLTKGSVYDMADTASSVSAGSYQQLFSVIMMKKLGLGYLPYAWIHTHYAVSVFEVDSWAEWAGVIIAIDFCYYWFHRASHECQILWWGHVVHHSSEFYNLSTALRQGVLQTPFGVLMHLPLALVFPPKIYLVQTQLNTLYQFWVHTQCIGKLGPLEWIFMTPSGHRVHHDRRVHKNYGGLLVIWDRLFGSYSEEQIEDGKRGTIYGVLNTPNSWNPAYCQAFQLVSTLKRMGQMTNWSSKMRVLLSGPGARSMASRTKLPFAPENAPNHRYRTKMTTRQIAYCAVHLGASIVMVNLCMAWQNPPMFTMISVAAGGLVSMASLGMLNDKHEHAVKFELLRNLALATACILALTSRTESLVPKIVLQMGAVLYSLSSALVVVVPAMFTENVIRTY